MFKRLIVVLALACACTLSASAQSLSTITGTLKDGAGNLITSGQVAFTLQPGVDTMVSGTARFSPNEVDCAINGSGLIKALDGVSACTLVQNTSLLPNGTSWKACIQPQFVQPGSCFVFYAVTSTLDLTTQVPTPPLTPAYSLVDVFSNQTINGNKTFGGNVIFTGPLTFGNFTAAGTFTANNGGTLGGSFAGNPTWSGNHSFNATVSVAGNATFGSGNPWFDVTSSIFNAFCDGSHDDTIPIQAAVAAARLLGADVRFPNGKTCVMATSSSPAINLDEAINTSLLCGTGAGRSRPGGGTNLTCTIHFTGTPAIAVGARASFGVAINGVALLADNGFTGNIVDTAHFPGDTRCGGNPCDTENFNLVNATVFGGTVCTNGVSMDKTILSNVTNSHFFGCINQLKGPSGSGSYANVIKVLDNDFNGSLGVLCYINNIGEAWDVERNTFEVNAAVASTICNSGGNADAKGFVFKSNWDGDDASAGIATKYVLPAGLRGAQISANTISNAHAATNLFNIGNNSKGVSVFANTYYVGSSYNVLYTLGTGDELDIGTNDYQGVTFSTFMSGSPVAGTISFSNGDKYTFGHQAVNLPLNVTPLSSLHVRAQSANSTGGLPTIFGAGFVVDGGVDVTSGGGTAKVYGVIATARTINSTSTEKAYAGWFKSFGFSGSSEEVAVHAEVSDAGTASTIFEGQVQSVQKFRFDGDGSFYLTKLLIAATAPTISSGFGTSPSIVSNNGAASFTINVGTGGTATNGVIGMPTATTGWNCTCQDKTTLSATVNYCRQTADTTATVTIGNFSSTFAAAAWVASDILYVSCLAR